MSYSSPIKRSILDCEDCDSKGCLDKVKIVGILTFVAYEWLHKNRSRKTRWVEFLDLGRLSKTGKISGNNMIRVLKGWYGWM